MPQERPDKCQLSGCVNLVWLDSNSTIRHEACGLKHHQVLMRHRLWESRDYNMEIVCQLPGCQRHAYVEAGPNGKVHDHCGRTHAKQAGHLTDDKGTVLRLNGGFPSPSYTNDQVVVIREPLQCLQARQLGKKYRNVPFMDTDIYASHPWDIPDIKRSLESANYEPPHSWYAFQKHIVKGTRVQRTTVGGWHWKQAGPLVPLEEKENKETGTLLIGERIGFSYEQSKKARRAGDSMAGVGGHWRMEEWNLIESEAEQESYLVLCQIKHLSKKRKRIGAPPLPSALASAFGPSPSLPLDPFIDGLFNHGSIDEITGPSEEMGSIEDMLIIRHIIDPAFTGSES